jgi:iron complex transport system substrate-binding protein
VARTAIVVRAVRDSAQPRTIRSHTCNEVSTVNYLRLFLLATALSIVSFTSPARAASHHVHHAAFPITLVDDHGNSVRLIHAPRRVVSLDPRDTETLFAIGAEKLVVADGPAADEGVNGPTRVFKYPSEWPSRWGRNYPLRSKSLPHIEGGCCGVNFDVEKITSLRPDLIVAPYSQTELPIFQQLRDLGMKVLILDPSNLKGILRDISLVGAATNNASHATTVIATIKKQIAAVQSTLKHASNRPRVYYEIDASNPEQPYTAGPKTFVDEAIRLAGGVNVADSASTCSGTVCYPQFSLEALVRLNPQVIILGDSAYGVAPSDVKARSGWSTMSAVTTGKIYPFDDSLVSRAGPSIAAGVAALARLIHPSAFKK